MILTPDAVENTSPTVVDSAPVELTKETKKAIEQRGKVERQLGVADAQRYRELVGPLKKEIQGPTIDTFANVLANEALALSKAQKDMEAEGQSFNPTGDLEWQKIFMKNVGVAFQAQNSNFDSANASRKDRFNAYYSVFQKLLKDSDPEQAEAWLQTAMLATKRQMIALQVAARVEASILKRGERIQHVSEVVASSPLRSESSGSLNRVIQPGITTEEMRRYGHPRWEFASKIVNWVHLRNPANRERFEFYMEKVRNEQEMSAEAQRRIFSTFEVDILPGEERDITDSYFIGDPDEVDVHNVRVNERKLDPVQRAFINEMLHLGTVPDGSPIQLSALNEAKIDYAAMVQAQQEAYFKQYGVQLINKEDLNLFRMDSEGRMVAVSPAGFLKTKIDGVGELPIGIDPTVTLDSQLEKVMKNIERKVDLKQRDLRATSEVLNHVEEQIKKLEAMKVGEQLTDDQKTRKAELTKEKEDKEAELTDINEFQKIEDDILAKEEEIKKSSARNKDAMEIKVKIDTANNTEKISTEAKNKAEIEKTKLEKEIQGCDKQIAVVQKKIDEDQKELEKLEITQTGNKSTLVQLQAQFSQAQQESQNLTQMSAQGNLSQASQIRLSTLNQTILPDLTARITTLTTQVNQIYTSTKNLLEGKIQANEERINLPLTGLEAIKTQKEGELNTAIQTIADETKKIEEAKEEIARLTTEQTAQQTIIDAHEQLETELKNLKAQRDLARNSIRSRWGINKSDITEEYIKLLTSDIEEVKKELDDFEQDTAVPLEDQMLQHQKDVLENFKEHFLSSSKWNGILTRANTPFDVFAAEGNLGNDSDYSVFALATRNRPHVPPAYLRMIQILGENKALERTDEGIALYKTLSSIVTPEEFFHAFETRYRDRLDALLQTHTGQGLTASMTVYDDSLQHPEIVRFMTRNIDISFINGLLSELIDRADNGELGKVSVAEAERLRDIAHKEKLIPEDATDNLRNREDEGIRNRKRDFVDRSHARRENGVSHAIHYVTNTLQLNRDLTGQLLDAVRVICLKAPIMVHTLADADFTPELEQIANEAFESVYTIANAPLPDRAQKLDMINTLLPLRLVSADTAAVNATASVATELGNVAIANPNHVQNIRIALRGIMAEGDLSSINIVDKLGDAALEDQILGAIEGVVGAGNLPPMLDKTAATYDKTRLVEILKRIAEADESSLEQARIVDRVSMNFMMRGGSEREGILINTLLASTDLQSARDIAHAFYSLESKNDPYELQQLFNHLPQGTRDFIIGQFLLIREHIDAFYASDNGIAAYNVNFDNPEEPNYVKNKDLEGYANQVLRIFRAKGFPQPLSASLTALIESEGAAYNELLNRELNRVSIESDISVFSQKYWGKEGSSLVLAIEQGLGGEAHRDSAIRIAREVEKLRARELSPKS